MRETNGYRAGYLVLQRPEVAIAEYAHTEFAIENGDILHQLRCALSFIDPAQYRGVSRKPLDEEELAGLNDGVSEGSQKGSIGGDDVVSSLDLARDLLGRKRDAERYELIYLESGEFTNRHETLGFDVGYWGGDHFSLIADVAVMPRWHPPPPEAFAAVAEFTRTLNEHVLFPGEGAASAFLAFYRSQDWAETEFEDGEFALMRLAIPRNAKCAPRRRGTPPA